MKKYQAIYKEIESQINRGVYPVNGYLPSESHLAQSYQVSRDTVRKALNLLEQAGLIIKKQGRPSQVLGQEHFNFPVSHLTSYQELVHSLGILSQTRVIGLDRLIIDKGLHELTGLPTGRQVWRVMRQRRVDGIASVLDIDYLLTDYVRQMTADIAQKSIYHYLEEDLQLDIAYAEKEITIVPLTDRDKIWLDIRNEHHVVSVQSRVYLADGQQFQFTESRHLLEKFHFVDYAQRKKD